MELYCHLVADVNTLTRKTTKLLLLQSDCKDLMRINDQLAMGVIQVLNAHKKFSHQHN